jgi:hypothetical protein
MPKPLKKILLAGSTTAFKISSVSCIDSLLYFPKSGASLKNQTGPRASVSTQSNGRALKIAITEIRFDASIGFDGTKYIAENESWVASIAAGPCSFQASECTPHL